MAYKIPGNISKGGLIGGLLGGLISTASHNEQDSFKKKAVKTGAFAAIGFVLGHFAEKVFRNRKS